MSKKGGLAKLVTELVKIKRFKDRERERRRRMRLLKRMKEADLEGLMEDTLQEEEEGETKEGSVDDLDSVYVSSMGGSGVTDDDKMDHIATLPCELKLSYLTLLLNFLGFYLRLRGDDAKLDKQIRSMMTVAQLIVDHMTQEDIELLDQELYLECCSLMNLVPLSETLVKILSVLEKERVRIEIEEEEEKKKKEETKRRRNRQQYDEGEFDLENMTEADLILLEVWYEKKMMNCYFYSF